MANAQWGHCKTCKHFGSPAARPLGSEEARCNQRELSRFELRIYGSNGCNAWELRAGLPQDAEGEPKEQAPSASAEVSSPPAY